MGIALLIVGLTVFLGSHLFVTARHARERMMSRLGGLYRPLFSVVSIAGIVLIIWGYATYRAHGWVDVWTPPAAMRHATVGLMLIASILVVAVAVPGRIRTRARHPMLAAVKTWAFAHLLSNGDLGSILLFGSFLAWGVYARIAAKKRGDAGPATTPAGWTGDVVVVLGGIVLYLALGYAFHPWVIGVPAFGR